MPWCQVSLRLCPCFIFLARISLACTCQTTISGLSLVCLACSLQSSCIAWQNPTGNKLRIHLQGIHSTLAVWKDTILFQEGKEEEDNRSKQFTPLSTSLFSVESIKPYFWLSFPCFSFPHLPSVPACSLFLAQIVI